MMNFKDLAQTAEDERIELMVRKLQLGLRVGFIVESVDNGAKGDRYLEKIRFLLPDITCVRTATGAPNVEFIQIQINAALPAAIKKN